MKHYFSFSEKATRSEYWAVQILNAVVLFFSVLFGVALIGVGSETSAFLTFIGTLWLFASILGSLWLSVSTCIRRCRDAAINPWWTLATVIPYLGVIPWVVIGVLKSENAQT